MPSKPQLNKEKIDQKLAELTFHCDDQVWNEFLDFHKKHKKKSIGFQFKFDAKYLLFPLGIVVVTSIVYLSVNNIKTQQSYPKNQFIGKSEIQAQQEIIKEIIPEKEVKPARKLAVIPKKDTTTANLEISDSNRINEEPVAIQTPASEAKSEVMQKNNEDSASSVKHKQSESSNSSDSVAHKENKRKKKRRNPAVSSETFAHHPEEDDIVVPGN